MPHKRNPITAERLSGLARLLRGYALAGMEDQALWHERDISHSSVERVALPSATTLLHYMLVRFRAGRRAGGSPGAHAREHRARPRAPCVEPAAHLSRRVGWHVREDAYAIVQRNALRAADERRQFRELVEADDAVTAALSRQQVADCFDDAALLRHVDTILGRLDQLIATGGVACPLTRQSGFVRSARW